MCLSWDRFHPNSSSIFGLWGDNKGRKYIISSANKWRRMIITVTFDWGHPWINNRERAAGACFKWTATNTHARKSSSAEIWHTHTHSSSYRVHFGRDTIPHFPRDRHALFSYKAPVFTFNSKSLFYQKSICKFASLLSKFNRSIKTLFLAIERDENNFDGGYLIYYFIIRYQFWCVFKRRKCVFYYILYWKKLLVIWIRKETFA